MVDARSEAFVQPLVLKLQYVVAVFLFGVQAIGLLLLARLDSGVGVDCFFVFIDTETAGVFFLRFLC